MSAREKIIKIGLPFVVLIAFGFVAMKMVKSRKTPEKQERIDRGALVEFITIEKSSHQVMVNSNGTVQPSQEVTLSPQVSGTVVSISPKFAAGGFFKEGETFFEIEKADYQLGLEQARAALAKREFELSSVESRAKIARNEWERLRKDQMAPPNSLVLYEPQLKDAKANLASAEAALKQAELNLSRTTLSAPFNCVVRSENIGLGQYVRAGNNVGVIAGTDDAEVVVPIELADLQWIDVPGQSEQGAKSSARIILDNGSRKFSWPGKIERLLAEVDPQGRMVRMVISITDPYLLQTKRVASQPALAIGSFVEVVFLGRQMQDVFVLPRQAIREDNTVWTVTSDNLLSIRNVKPIRFERDKVFVSEGLEPGNRLVLTNLTGAAEGMKLRPSSLNYGQNQGEGNE